MSGNYRVEVSVERRDDGGLRVWSADLPELVLSHSDADAVLADLPVALAEILSARFGAAISVEELRDLQVATQPSKHAVQPGSALQYVARAA